MKKSYTHTDKKKSTLAYLLLSRRNKVDNHRSYQNGRRKKDELSSDVRKEVYFLYSIPYQFPTAKFSDIAEFSITK